MRHTAAVIRESIVVALWTRVSGCQRSTNSVNAAMYLQKSKVVSTKVRIVIYCWSYTCSNAHRRNN